jgi:hypothetical protein
VSVYTTNRYGVMSGSILYFRVLIPCSLTVLLHRAQALCGIMVLGALEAPHSVDTMSAAKK